MKLHLVAAAVWIATVTATFESDSHGNQTNEKNETYADTQQRFLKQVVQPYLLPAETKLTEDGASNKSTNGALRATGTHQNASNDIVTVEYLPFQEIALPNASIALRDSSENSFNRSGLVTDERIAAENVADFGQRIRSVSFNHRNENLGRLRSRQTADEEYRKQHRKNARPLLFKKLNFSENAPGVSLEHGLDRSHDDHHVQRTLKRDETGGEYLKVDHLESNKTKPIIIPWTVDQEASRSATRDSKPRQKDFERDGAFATNDTRRSTAAPVLTVSLGKFSGPIVVPDLPHRNKYPFTPTTNHNDPLKVVSTTPNTKEIDANYLGASQVVLNPLQVGVALMNAGQDMNSVSDSVNLPQIYIKNESQPPLTTDNLDNLSNLDNLGNLDNQRTGQNDGSVLGNSDLQSDQLSQQEQISEVVSNSPTQSVEIQKSVEIFHTAPVHEIHYPPEFVPHAQQSHTKQRFQEEDRKPQKGHFKEHRPSQVNVYKNNEIINEIVSSNNQEHGKYEYNVNENDVGYSNAQADQALPLASKTSYTVKEQVDNTRYIDSLPKYSRVQPNSEFTSDLVPKEIASNFDSTIVTQSPKIEGLPGVVNLESPQGTPEVSQILLAKTTSDTPMELRLLMTVPQPFPVEKVIEKTVHVPQPLNVVEKKLPYPVEKVIEKQITIPHPFPVHIPIDRVVEKQIRIPYPVHVEKVIEKKVPFAIQRFVVPFPFHFRVSQAVEKPFIEKVHEKHARPYTLENAKLVKSVAIPVYNVHNNDGNYQMARQQSFQTLPGPLYEPVNDDQSYLNTTQYYGLGYAAIGRQPSMHGLPKKFGSHGVQYPHLVAYSTSINHNGNPYGRGAPEKDKIIDEYVGPVPRKVIQTSLGMQSKSMQYASDAQATMRRTRQEVGNTGSFRQSKMEYGFKPPMIPSVQYDEQTATKVE
ncbi:uncharacterized protein LOC128893016 isoform X2 [Hylaeus anthracinus]|uniref:uncharacterized protein LOC128893016 isoform X2 n=1 Tax=Hylaeus anthracinus TaxID=313031 RepID=UPI0023B9042E|nr:uncharacterized protein LOC128893016 isoform X2 [Hylaeus anthracinus]